MLPNLTQRPKYRPPGFCAPLYVLLVAAACAGMLVAGYLSSLLGSWVRSDSPGPIFMAFSTVLPFALFAFASIATIKVNIAGRVQRWWLVLLANLAFAFFFLTGLLMTQFMDELGSSGDGWGLVWVIVKFVFMLPLFWLVGYNVSCHEGHCVYYPVDGGKLGERLPYYFKSMSGKRVLEALQSGDAGALAQLRSWGPNAASHAYQNFTVMTLTRCPDRPDLPMYLHLKDVWMGGGPLYSTRIHSALGWSHLSHVRIEPQDLQQLRYLLPDFLNAEGNALGQMRPESLATAQAVGAASPDTPVGFPVGAPPSARSENGTLVEPVPADERRRLAGRYWAGLLPTLGVLVVTIALSIAFASLALHLSGGPPVRGPLRLLAFFPLIVGMVATLACLAGWPMFGGWFMGRAIASRKNRLFVPVRGASQFVGVEDARTFHKTKLLPEDYAVLHAQRGELLIEMSRSRMRIRGEDLSVSYHTAPNGAIGLQLSARIGDYPWEVTVTPVGTGVYILGQLQNPKRRAEALWLYLHKEMQGAPSETPAGGSA